MANLKVNEIYSSIQGEGPNAYQPTTFVRFGGCNLRCPGWGTGQLPDGTWVMGCDTIHAVYPEFRHEWHVMTPEEIVKQVDPVIRLVCFTGGEPLIQPKDRLSHLAWLLFDRNHIIEMFTNGTQLLPQWINEGPSYIIMDFKLPGSGEYSKFNWLNLDLLRPQDTIKFVCKDPEDVEKGFETIQEMKKHGTRAKFSFGVVWNSEWLTEADVAELVAETAHPEISLNIQLHKHIWDPNERKR